MWISVKVGVIVLISVYMLSGAAMFHHVERDSLMQVAEEAATAQRKAAFHLWNITGETEINKFLQSSIFSLIKSKKHRYTNTYNIYILSSEYYFKNYKKNYLGSYTK